MWYDHFVRPSTPGATRAVTGWHGNEHLGPERHTEYDGDDDDDDNRHPSHHRPISPACDCQPGVVIVHLLWYWSERDPNNIDRYKCNIKKYAVFIIDCYKNDATLQKLNIVIGPFVAVRISFDIRVHGMQSNHSTIPCIEYMDHSLLSPSLPPLYH